MFELMNHDAAFRFVRSWLVANSFGNVSPAIPANKGRHCLLKTDKGTFYCLFKHEFFWKFPEYYKGFLDLFPELNGAGESINVDCLMNAESRGFSLLYVYSNHAIYIVEPSEILKCHDKAKAIYPNGLIRSQDRSNEYKVAYSNGVSENVNEATIVFPVKLLKRLN